VARFVAWLRAPAGNVVVLAGGSGAREAATVNRYLAGVFGFYDHHARTGLAVAAGLVSLRRASRGSYKPFLHHVTKGRPISVRPVKLHVLQRSPRTLEAGQVVAILAACEHLRDRFLLSLLAETGMRVGQALRLRHADFVSRKREVHIVPRADNANKVRAKLRSATVIPVSTPLVRLYSEYMHAEYGDIDSDYVFVNLFGGQAGAAMTYSAVHKLIGRIAARTGIGFTAHTLRHSHATDMVRQGVPVEVVARLLTHRSPATTSQTYVHLDAADIREVLYLPTSRRILSMSYPGPWRRLRDIALARSLAASATLAGTEVSPAVPRRRFAGVRRVWLVTIRGVRHPPHDSRTDQEKIVLIGQLHLLGRWHAGAVTLRL
jgi:integrase